jgi:hypothetical protein
LLNIDLAFGSVEAHAKKTKTYEEFRDTPVFTLVGSQSWLWIIGINEIKEALIPRHLTGFPLGLYIRAWVTCSSRYEKRKRIRNAIAVEVE